MKLKKWKKVMGICLCMIMAVSFVGCSNSKEATSGESKKEETSNKKVELTGLVQQSRWYSGLQDMVKKLEEEENIVIDFQVVPDDQYDNLLKMKLNADEAPDLIAYQFADIFAAVDPEKFFVPLDGQDWTSKVIAPELSTYDGKNYGYVFESSNGFQGLIYNKDVFEENGITELPKTLDEFYGICDQLKEKGITPIAMPSDTWVPQIWMTSGFSRALGSESACEEFANEIITNQAKFKDYPQMAAVVDEYLDLFKKGYINEDFLTVSYDEILGRIANGEIAMIYGATEILTSIEESYPDCNLSIFNPPVGYDDKDVIAYLPTSLGLAVSKDSKNLDTIETVFNLWSTEEYGNLYFEKRPGFPNIEGIDGNEEKLNPAIPQIYKDYFDKGKVVAQMNQYIDTLQPLFGNTLWVYFLEAPAKGNMDGNAVMNRFQEDVDNFMKEKKADGWN